MALTALLLPGCLDWETEHREAIEITLADVDPGLRVGVEEDRLVLSLDIDRGEDEDCFHLDAMRVTLDGVSGGVLYGGWAETSAFNADECKAPGATFDVPKEGPASFVVSSPTNDAIRWTMDIDLRTQPITWSKSTAVYHPGDTVTINVPSLGAAQLPTIHIYNGELVVKIDASDIVRVGTEARFEIPELSGVDTPMTATMDVSAMVSPAVVKCAAPKGCTATPFVQTLSSSISLAP